MTEKTSLSVSYIDTKKLIPYVNNARVHDDYQINQIAASISEFGFNNPILTDGKNGVVAGHGRLAAAMKLGLREVPVIELSHLSESQKKAYILADNRISENARWDQSLLKIEIKDLESQGVNLDLLGFSDEEMEELLLGNDAGGGKEGEDIEIPEPPVQPVTKPGDIWTLGKHRLMCGDACSYGDMVRLCGEEQTIALYLTDPPYNVAYEGKTKDRLTISNDEMESDDFRKFLTDAFTNADTVLMQGGVIYICLADTEQYNFRGACIDAGWKIRQTLIWNKNALVLGRQDYQWKHEPILYGWKDGAAHAWFSDRSQTTVIDWDRPNANREHPTMKPVGLFRYLMENSSKAGDVVLDSFGGSGTTLIAAEECGRIARVMEMDPKYCDVIIRRWQQMTGLDAILESTQETFESLTV